MMKGSRFLSLGVLGLIGIGLVGCQDNTPPEKSTKVSSKAMAEQMMNNPNLPQSQRDEAKKRFDQMNQGGSR